MEGKTVDLRQQVIDRVLQLDEEKLQKVIDWLDNYREQHKNQ